MSVCGDSSLSIQFLKLVLPQGPWALTAIFPDRKATKTATFYPAQEAECLDWIKLYNEQTNIYWHVNPVMRAVSKKAMREDIKEVVQLHVDLDPRVGEDIEKEKVRILKLLQNPPAGIPVPTTILFSGGGYQAFWALEEPIPINGDLSAAEDAKLYNITLEHAFGADNCHNIDRLCRLVGTVNIPDAKKRKKGRTEQLSILISHNSELSYDIKQFKKTQGVQSAQTGGFSTIAKTVQISGNIQRIDSVEDLNEWDVPDRVKVIIVQGSDTDNPKQGDNSRSAWLFDCICQLVRAKVPDDVIFSIVTDPDFRISESILEMKGSAEKYALRQIERAKEYSIDPWLQLLNERHAVIQNLGGKCRVIEEVFDPVLSRTRITKQGFDDFRNSYMNVFVTIGQTKEGMPVKKAAGKWWLEHEQRRQFRTITFAPGREVVDAYNLWKGFACEAVQGDCSEFLQHVKDNICSGNLDHYKYLVGWMARCVQQPDSAGQVAIVMRGGMGTGKGFFASQFGSLFGRHFLQVADPKHLVGAFNSHLRDTVVLFGDEAFYAGDKKHESVLRMLITEESLAIEAKGIDVEVSPNFTHVILASNHSWVVPAGADERRFFVLDVGDHKKQNIQYFSQLKKQMNSGGREALLHFLQSYDLTEYEVREVPKTKALNDQKILSMTPEEEWWFVKLEEGRILQDQDIWETNIIKDDLFMDYTDYIKRFNIRSRANRTMLGKFLHKVFPNLRTFQKATVARYMSSDGHQIEKKVTPYFYEFPTLEKARKRWEEVYGEQFWPNYGKIEPLQEIMENETPF